MHEHDYVKFPELRKAQLEDFGFTSPHKQITEDFRATVVRVHDGDTVTLRTNFRDFDFPLRLLGIDAPELNEDGGDIAQIWLSNRILNEKVDIIIDKKNRVDKYGRLLGELFHRGINIGEELLIWRFAVPFGQRGEGMLPNMDKELSIKKWLKVA